MAFNIMLIFSVGMIILNFFLIFKVRKKYLLYTGRKLRFLHVLCICIWMMTSVILGKFEFDYQNYLITVSYLFIAIIALYLMGKVIEISNSSPHV
jgi:hypothetical protein